MRCEFCEQFDLIFSMQPSCLAMRISQATRSHPPAVESSCDANFTGDSVSLPSVELPCDANFASNSVSSPSDRVVLRSEFRKQFGLISLQPSCLAMRIPQATRSHLPGPNCFATLV